MSVGHELVLDSENYTVIRELGRGGMGVVYLAEDLQLRRQVALKVLYGYLNRDEAFVERFREEARSVATLHHSNIVCVHGLEHAGDVLAIDMEFVDGSSLDQVLNPTPHFVVGLARDVLGGLAACHHIGVVHRDIKPSNILLNQAGRAKITDFGLARAYARHLEATVQGNTSSGFYMGTPRYMPVQAWEGGKPEPFWDLYSFGVVLHELLSGEPAFRGENPMMIMRKQIAEPLLPLDSQAKHLSPQLSALVSLLLSSCRNSGSEISADYALELLRKTPEYHELNESDGTMTITLPARTLRKNRSGGEVRARTLPKALAGIFVVALLGMAALFLGRTVRNAEPAVEEKKELANPGLMPVSVSDVPIQFFEVASVNRPELGPFVWMVELDPSGSPAHVTGMSPLELWSFTVGPRSDGGRLSINGFWGARMSPNSWTSYHGSLSGFLLWEPTAGRLSVHAQREQSHDNVREALSLTGYVKEGGYGQADFVTKLEANSALQGLLYRELLERRLPWAIALEAMMPAPPLDRVVVPIVNGDVTVDGDMGETFWTEAHFNASGRIGELSLPSDASGAKLLVRSTGEAVYLGARVKGCGDAPRLEIGLLPALELSTTQSGRFFVSIGEAGTEESRYLVGLKEKPWDCDWRGRISLENDEATLELGIPVDFLDAAAQPRSGKRWRINARLTSLGPDGNRRVVAEWGAEDHDALEHGALLTFE